MVKGKFTVNEVQDRTEVPASTLRQWERRYGFPKPERTGSGYRLYSDDDLHAIERMRRFIGEGIPASRAAELAQAVPAERKGPRPTADFARELTEALIGLDEGAANGILSEAHALHAVESVMREVIRPALVEIGRRWHEGSVSVTTEHFASEYLQGRLRALLGLAGGLRYGPAVIVACAPFDQHELGALMLAVALRRSGYRVYFLGANTPVADLRAMAHSLKPLALMISAARTDTAGLLLEQREELQELAPVLAFGGAAFDEQPSLAASLGGTYLGSDLEHAVERFQEHVKQLGSGAS